MAHGERSCPFPVSGTFTALVTPFSDPPEREVDLDDLGRLVEAQIAGGVDGVVPCGTTGESPTLSHEEHDRVVAHVVETVAGRVPVIAGTGSNSTREALRLTLRAAEVGADGALVVCPYYNRPTQRMLVSHFGRIAAASPIPIILYNVPSRTGVNLEPESGSDELTVAMMSLGGTGVVSVASNVVPGAMVEMVRAALEGDYAAAGACHARLFPLFEALFVEPNPTPVKRARQILGNGNGEVREPLLRALPATDATLSAALSALGLLNR